MTVEEILDECDKREIEVSITGTDSISLKPKNIIMFNGQGALSPALLRVIDVRHDDIVAHLRWRKSLLEASLDGFNPKTDVLL